jgi:hypothetical protein
VSMMMSLYNSIRMRLGVMNTAPTVSFPRRRMESPSHRNIASYRRVSALFVSSTNPIDLLGFSVYTQEHGGLTGLGSFFWSV